MPLLDFGSPFQMDRYGKVSMASYLPHRNLQPSISWKLEHRASETLNYPRTVLLPIVPFRKCRSDRKEAAFARTETGTQEGGSDQGKAKESRRALRSRGPESLRWSSGGWRHQGIDSPVTAWIRLRQEAPDSWPVRMELTSDQVASTVGGWIFG